MRKFYQSLIAFLILSVSAQAQNVGIDTETPDAKLDIVSSSSGVLIPRIALSGTNDVTTIPSPTTSELIYNTVSAGSGATAVNPGFYYWNGAWVPLLAGPFADDDWTRDATNGDLSPTTITDKVGIGTNAPSQLLHVLDGEIYIEGTMVPAVQPTLRFNRTGNIISNTGIDIILDEDNNSTNSNFIVKHDGESKILLDIAENGRASIGKGVALDNVLLDLNSNTTSSRGLLIPNMDIANLSTAAPVSTSVDPLSDGMLAWNTNTTTGPNLVYWSVGDMEWKVVTVADDEDIDWLQLNDTKPTSLADNIYTNGNVGIATNTPDPDYGLTVQTAGENTDLVKIGGENFAIHATMNAGAEDVITADHASTSSSANFHAVRGLLSAKGNTSGYLGYFRDANNKAYGVFSDNGDYGGYFENAVGIGVLDPAQMLHIQGTARLSNLAGVNSRVVIANSLGDLSTTTAGTDGQILYMNGTNIDWQDPSAIGDHDWYQTLSSNIPTSITDWIRTEGRVGIGFDATINPNAPLEVFASGAGNPFNNSILSYNRNNAGGQDAIITTRVAGTSAGDPFISMDVEGESGWSIGLDNSHDNRLKIAWDWANLSNNTRMTILTGGNVGIGTVDPSWKLDVRGFNNDDAAIIQAANSDASHFLKLYPGRLNDAAPFIQWKTGDPLRFATDGSGFTEYMRILGTNGFVGIGTTNPSGKLHVNNTDDSDMVYGTTGNISVYNSESYTGEVRLGAAWNRPGVYSSNQLELFSDNTGIIFGDSDIERMRMTAAGYLGVGLPNPDALVHIADIFAAGGRNLEIGDDTYFTDVDQANLLGLYGIGDPSVAGLRLGSSGSYVWGKTGNIGINTTDPTHRLHIYSQDQETVRLQGPNAVGTGARLNFGDADYVWIGEEIDDRLHLRTTTMSIEVEGSLGNNFQVLTSDGTTASWEDNDPSAPISDCNIVGTYDLPVVVYYGSFGNENSWQLRDNPTTNVGIIASGGNGPNYTTVYNNSHTLNYGQTYYFEAFDSYGDGWNDGGYFNLGDPMNTGNISVPGYGLLYTFSYQLCTNTSTKQLIVRGSIQSDGDIIGGGGFDLSSTGNGRYEITFNTPFSDRPSATVTQVFSDFDSNGWGGSTLDNAIITHLDQNKMHIVTGDGGGTPTNRDFSFIVIGSK